MIHSNTENSPLHKISITYPTMYEEINKLSNLNPQLQKKIKIYKPCH